MSATAVLNLSKAGFTDAQMKARAEYFDPQMATKANVEEIRFDIGKVRSDLSLEIEKIRSDLKQKIAVVDLRISESKVDVIKWVAGPLIAQGAAMVALIRLLPGAHL
jgi:hypothetical protein